MADSGSSSTPRARPAEAVAFAVVRRVLGVTVQPYDCGGRQRAVGAQLHYPDGRLAALK